MISAVGVVVGVALGLAGAGGSILAVPLLIVAVDLRPQDAMGISLGAVSVAAMVGVLLRRGRGKSIDWRAAVGLAITGMCAAPFGRWLANQFDDNAVLVLFCIFALFVAVRIWRDAVGENVCQNAPLTEHVLRGRAPRTFFLLAGAVLGLLAGFFGVGGGFVIVPFLTLVSRIEIEKAISTSLIVVSLVSMSGYLYHIAITRTPNVHYLIVIGLGSILGIVVGTTIGARLSGRRLQRLFSGLIMTVMAFMLVQSFT